MLTVSRSAFVRGVAAGALALAAPAPTRAADQRPVTIGYVPSTLLAPVFVAYDRGFLAANGIAANLTPIVAGQDAIALLAQGQLDAVAGGLSAAFYNGVDRGFEIRLAGSSGFQPRRGHPSGLLVRSDLYEGGLRDVRALRGKKIAWIGGNGAVASYYVARILRPAGLTLRDIEIVPLANPDQGIAFERKAIDAAFTNSPFTIEFEQKRLAKFLVGPPAGISGTGVFVGPNLLKNTSLGRDLIDACRRGAATIAGRGYDDPANLKTYEKYTKQPAETLRTQDRYDYDPRMRVDTATLEDMQREFLAQGVLAYKSPIPIDRLIVKL